MTTHLVVGVQTGHDLLADVAPFRPRDEVTKTSFERIDPAAQGRAGSQTPALDEPLFERGLRDRDDPGFLQALDQGVRRTRTENDGVAQVVERGRLTDEPGAGGIGLTTRGVPGRRAHEVEDGRRADLDLDVLHDDIPGNPLSHRDRSGGAAQEQYVVVAEEGVGEIDHASLVVREEDGARLAGHGVDDVRGTDTVEKVQAIAPRHAQRVRRFTQSQSVSLAQSCELGRGFCVWFVHGMAKDWIRGNVGKPGLGRVDGPEGPV